MLAYLGRLSLRVSYTGTRPGQLRRAQGPDSQKQRHPTNIRPEILRGFVESVGTDQVLLPQPAAQNVEQGVLVAAARVLQRTCGERGRARSLAKRGGTGTESGRLFLQIGGEVKLRDAIDAKRSNSDILLNDLIKSAI